MEGGTNVSFQLKFRPFISSLNVFCLLFSSFFLKASKFYLKLLLLSLVDGTTGMSGGAVLGVAGVKLFFFALAS